MTLLERCQNVRAQIEQRDVLRLAHKEAEAFRERADELGAIRAQFAAEIGKLIVLKRKGITVTNPATPTVAVRLLRDYESKLAINPAESGKDYGSLKRSIGKISKDILLAVAKALDSVKRDLPTIEEGFLKQVELIPTYTAQAARIRQERDGLLNGKDLRSMTSEDLEHFLDRRNALRTLADQLNPDEFPKEVLEFFKAARRGGAPLEKFTAIVQEWLTERDQLKNVRVLIQS